MKITNIDIIDAVVRFTIEMPFDEYLTLCQKDKDFKILKVHFGSSNQPFQSLALTHKEWKELGVDLRSLWYGADVQKASHNIDITDDIFETFMSV